jgi:arylsulfatase A-like enzyme
MRAALAVCLIFSACGDDTTRVPPQPGAHIIFIDIDDHGLGALWDSNSPNLQRFAKEGTLAYSRVDIPTHSNQSNITLLTGAWPEVTDVPHNSWLDRSKNYSQPFSLFSLSQGSYIYYDLNPLGARVESLYSAAHAAGLKSTFVGLLPPFEHGADEVHFTVYQSELLGLFQVTKQLADAVFMQLRYPADVTAQFHLDGPPMMNEPVNTFTLRDAGIIFDKAVAGGPPPPQFMFIWDYIELDGAPTNIDGADGAGVKGVVEAIDKGLGQLIQSVHNAGYDDRMSYVVTLDHGKVNTNNQVVFEKQLADLVTTKGSMYGVTAMDWKSLNEDGDVLVYATVPNAGTAAGAAAQQLMAHHLVDMIHDAALAGQFQGLDISRTITWDGYRGTRRFIDIRSTGPNNPDIIMFPIADWTLGDTAKNMTVGPIGHVFGRHGGFSEDELYVPAIFYGPAFKKGVLLPEPIDHPDVAPTVAAAIGMNPPTTAEGGVVTAALASDMSGVETLMFPADPRTTRPTVLQNTGYDGSAPHLTTPAQGAIIVDATGLYEDAMMPGPNLAALIAQGAHFTGFRTRFRDLPVNEYQLLTGTYPSGSVWIPFAEDDPAQVGPPGLGEFAMPPAANFVSDPSGKTAWAGSAATDKYADQSIFEPAKQMGFTTVVMGSATSLQHVPATSVDIIDPTMTLDQILGAHARSLVYIVAAGDGEAELGMVKSALQTANVSDRYIVALVSRGAAAIDAAGADAHGAGSARHVPLVIAGPNIRHALIGMPSTPLDVAPTILFALGATAQAPDLAFGVQLDGGPGMDQQRLPLPTGDRAGKVLLPAFNH